MRRNPIFLPSFFSSSLFALGFKRRRDRESEERARRDRRRGVDLCRLVPSIYCFSLPKVSKLSIGISPSAVSSVVLSSRSFSLPAPSAPPLSACDRGPRDRGRRIRCDIQELVLE